jgi:hypothetical protein
VEIRARYTSWTRLPAPTVRLGDLTILAVRVVNDTTLSVDVESSRTTPLGPRALRVVHGSQALFRATGLTLRLPDTAPSLLSVNPAPLQAGGIAELRLSDLLGRSPAELAVDFGGRPGAVLAVEGADLLKVAVPGGNANPAVRVEFVGPGGPLRTNSILVNVEGAGVDLPISRGQTIQGELANTAAIDRYRFTAQAGARITVAPQRLPIQATRLFCSTRSRRFTIPRRR